MIAKIVKGVVLAVGVGTLGAVDGGCLSRPAVAETATTKTNFVDNVHQAAVDKIDILFEDAAMARCCEFPSLLEGFCHAPVGSQPFIRRSPHMMGFGHVPTGSIRYSASPAHWGPRQFSSSRRAVSDSAHAASWRSRQRTSPSRRP